MEEDQDVAEIVEESAPTNQEAENSELNQETEQAQTEEKKDGLQKRFKKLTADRYKEKDRADRAEKALEKLRSEGQRSSPPSLEDSDIDFDQDKLEDARIDYKVAQTLKKERQLDTDRKSETKRAQESDDFFKRVEKTGLDRKEYSETIGTLLETVRLDNDVVTAIIRDEKGPELAYYLGKNLDKADEIANLDPISAALELGKISSKLSVGKPIKTTKAPEPIDPVNGSGGLKKSKDKMSMAEVMAS